MGLKIELFPAKATGTGLDGLKREDFKTDEAFLEAATQRQMELDNPAYIKARTKLRQFAAASLAAPLPIFAPTSFLPCGPCHRFPPDNDYYTAIAKCCQVFLIRKF